MRPSTLAEVAVRSSTDPGWQHHLDEFLDAFYGVDRARSRAAPRMIAPPPSPPSPAPGRGKPP